MDYKEVANKIAIFAWQSPTLSDRIEQALREATAEAYRDAAEYHAKLEIQERNLFDNTIGRAGSLATMHTHGRSNDHFEKLARAAEAK